jgi:hypothetical protein
VTKHRNKKQNKEMKMHVWNVGFENIGKQRKYLL